MRAHSLPSLLSLQRYGRVVRRHTRGEFAGNTDYEMDGYVYTVHNGKVIASEPEQAPRPSVTLGDLQRYGRVVRRHTRGTDYELNGNRYTARDGEVIGAREPVSARESRFTWHVDR